jgi:small-conductance mechanosensitive channel
MTGTTIATAVAAAGGRAWWADLLAQVPPFAWNVSATVVAVAVTTAILSRSDALHDRNPALLPTTLWHFLVAIATMAVAVASVVGILGVWGLTDPLLDLFQEYDVGTETAVQIALSTLFLVGAYATTGLVHRLLDEVARSQSNVSDHQREIVYRIAQVVLYIVATIFVLEIWNVDLGGLLVGAGFLGIVLGMAARQTLGALLAGFVLMFSRPFEIGDWIVVGDYEGIVTDITVVNTRIQTFEGEYVMVPNDVVSSESLVNRSRKGRLRIEVDVGVDYDDDPQHAADVALAAVEELDGVLDVPSAQVVFKQFADSSVVLGIRFWIDRPSARRKWRTRTAAIGAVKDAFDREGISIPFPQRSIQSRDGDGDPVVAGDADPAAATDGGDGSEGDR